MHRSLEDQVSSESLGDYRGSEYNLGAATGGFLPDLRL